MGKQTDLTFNVDSEDLRDAGEFLSWVTAANPKFLFIMNGLGRARQIKNAFPTITIIHRSFDIFNDWRGGANPTFDNTFWQSHSVHQTIEWMKANLGAYKDFIHTVGNNEPSHNDGIPGKTLDDMLQWQIDLMDSSRAAGFRMAIGEFASAKSIRPEDVDAGRWDKWLKAIKRHEGWHLPTSHAYTTGILPATLMPDYPENLFHREALQRPNWPKAFPLGHWGYHLLREELLETRSVYLGLGRFKYGITEATWDMMADINNHNQALSRLKDAHGIPAYNNDIRGVLAHRKFFEWVLNKRLNDAEFSEYVFEQVKWMAEIYPDDCLFQAAFGWNQDWEIPEGADFSVPALRHYRNLVASYNPSEEIPMPEPIPDETWQEKIVRAAADNVRIRRSPSLSGERVGTASIGTSGIRTKVSNRVTGADGYNWLKFYWQGEVVYAALGQINPLVDLLLVQDVPSENLVFINFPVNPEIAVSLAERTEFRDLLRYLSNLPFLKVKYASILDWLASKVDER